MAVTVSITAAERPKSGGSASVNPSVRVALLWLRIGAEGGGCTDREIASRCSEMAPRCRARCQYGGKGRCGGECAGTGHNELWQIMGPLGKGRDHSLCRTLRNTRYELFGSSFLVSHRALLARTRTLSTGRNALLTPLFYVADIGV